MPLDASAIGMAVAFLAGAVSFLSPCVLPLVPAYLSYIAGQSLDGTGQPSKRAGLPVIVLSALFVLGFSFVFVSLGAGASAIGQFFLRYRYEANIVGGVLIVLFGLLLTGLVRIPWLHGDLRLRPDIVGGRPVPAFVLGVAFGFGWTPCIGPVLGAVLTMSASIGTLSQGVALLGAYSLGLGVPFLIAAWLTRRFAKRIKMLSRIGRSLNVGAGLIMVILGIAMITGYLSVFAFWILDTFPIFSTIG